MALNKLFIPTLATSHGTDALHLAMLAFDLKRGDKVVCSVNAHPSVPEVVRHFDAEPVFICPALVATAMSAMVVSSVSPERWDMTAV